MPLRLLIGFSISRPSHLPGETSSPQEPNVERPVRSPRNQERPRKQRHRSPGLSKPSLPHFRKDFFLSRSAFPVSARVLPTGQRRLSGCQLEQNILGSSPCQFAPNTKHGPPPVPSERYGHPKTI